MQKFGHSDWLQNAKIYAYVYNISACVYLHIYQLDKYSYAYKVYGYILTTGH